MIANITANSKDWDRCSPSGSIGAQEKHIKNRGALPLRGPDFCAGTPVTTPP